MALVSLRRLTHGICAASGLAAAFAVGHGAIRRGGGPLGAEIQVTSSTKRAPLRLIAGVAGGAAIIVAFTATVSAQSGSDFLNNIDPLFAGVVAHPGNLDNTIAYAASAAAHGDIESAISTYEQLRFYNPRLAATRYQLGVLYYQLGSYAQARGYLQTALQMPDVTPELRQRIEDLLELVDKSCSPINSSVSRKPACAIKAMPVSAPDRRPYWLPAERLTATFLPDRTGTGSVLSASTTSTISKLRPARLSKLRSSPMTRSNFHCTSSISVSLNFAPVRVLRFRRATSTA